MTTLYVVPIGEPEPKFSLGDVYVTRAAEEALSGGDIADALIRHCTGDWGDVTDNDRRQNEDALMQGGRLLSVYHMSAGLKFWIITEADRSTTTVLLPDDY